MFTQFKQKLVARLTKFAYLIVPCGSVIPMMATEIQEGYLVINGQNVYEAEHKRLYDVLAKNNNLSKGSDGKGNYVKLPDPNGRCIELTSNVSFVGKLLAAALPNIRGMFNSYGIGSVPQDFNIYWNGPFSVVALDKNKSHVIDTNTTTSLTQDFKFDLSKGNQTFAGSKLQPSALQLLACIRI